ncbi:MAG: amylosucrase [Clostridiales bacterium]|nr:amylosucrase [Clostridiales bacterium]
MKRTNTSKKKNSRKKKTTAAAAPVTAAVETVEAAAAAETPAEAAEPKTAAKAETKTEVKAEAKVEPKKVEEPKAVVKAEAKAEPKKAEEPKAAAKAEVKVEPKKVEEPKAAVKAEAKAEPKKVEEPKTAAKAETKAEPKKVEEPKAAVKAEAKAEPKKAEEPKAAVKAEEKAEPKKVEEPKAVVKAEVKAEPKKAEEPKAAAKAEAKAEPKKVEEPKAAVKAAKKTTRKSSVVKKATEAAAKTVETAKKAAADAAKKAAEAAEAAAAKAAKAADDEFYYRMEKRNDELRWLYMEMYGNDSMYAELCDNLHRFYVERNRDLKAMDIERENNPNWYKSNDMLGMMLYIDNFAGNIKGVESKLDYLEKSNVNYIHLMPFLDTVPGKSDGGYAVKDFRKVREDLGTMEDLEHLTAACHKKNMNVCMDFVMNHTSEDHEWARRARAGEGEYMSRYFFFDNAQIPDQFESTVPQVFPRNAPGNFTWLPDIGHYVMTTFYPYQWDLNYLNPRVFNEMMYNFLFLANKGIDVIRIDAVPYIWKELGTQCRNLRRVHTIVRMMRIIGEIVCPSVLLLGEVVMEPEKVVPYFGTVEKPECHMLYNVTTMATTWHTVATRDVSLLKRQLDIVAGLPKEYVFLNYLRCHDDIGWGLDYDFLKARGQEEVPHKKFLNDYFQGFTENSKSRGELYEYDPVTQDARFCATTASMCGVEKAGFEQNEAEMAKAIDLDVMLHAYMFTQSGIPVIYSGDEIGQVNDYTYKNDPNKAHDSRYIHRGAMRWDLAENIENPDSVEGRIFNRLSQLEQLRKTEKVFMTNADMWTVETYDPSILCIGRYYEGEKMFGLFNFSEYDKTAWINETDGMYENMLTGEVRKAAGVDIPGYGFCWLKKL